MSSFRNSPVSNPSETIGEVVLSLRTVHKMLPLVQRIVDDVLLHHKKIETLQPEELKLDREKRDLGWPARQRRYQLKDEIADADRGLQSAFQELRDLGLVLLDPIIGQIGFPTLVNNRKAYFSWHPGEDSLRSWLYADESTMRPIPSSWLKELNLSTMA